MTENTSDQAAAETRLMALEEQVAHLAKTIEELSDVVARQEQVIEVSTRRLTMLMQREAGREADGGGTVALADQRPPHW
ncbi:MAG: SlyX family protein [Pacificibacter sp.]|uniref:SlyX family protein n=1 Tax=Pacificibacter sp. TaxID=1917866 RepID=UPI00321A26A8